MRALWIGLTGLLICAAAAADDATAFSRSVPAAPQDRIEISNVAGAVKITAWDKAEVDVQGRLGSGVERVDVERHGGVVEVRVVVRKRFMSWGDNDVYADLQVHVPAASALEVSTVSARLEVEGGHGKMRLKTVSGGVRAVVQSNDLEIQTVSGRIVLRSGGSNATVRATTVSGGIELADLSGELDARTTSGSLKVDANGMRIAQLHTVSGSIEFRGRLLRDAKLEAQSVSARVVVVLAADAGYRYELTSYSGSITNCFGADAQRVSGGSAKRLNGTRGAGAASVFIKSLSGSVSLCDPAPGAPVAPLAPARPQGDISKVNGSIQIADGVNAGRAQTVNGSIRMGAAATAAALGTVNGSIVVGDRARIAGSVATVNGSVVLGKQVEVAGDVSSVNGTIRLDNAHVQGKLETTNSSIEIGENSRVDGGIHVHGCWRSGFWNGSSCKGTRVTPLRVVIGIGAVVQGTLKFDREVELYVSEQAKVGPVQGATPIRFSGRTPPLR